jgi:hypothetical protein
LAAAASAPLLFSDAVLSCSLVSGSRRSSSSLPSPPLRVVLVLGVEVAVAMTRLGCQWDRQPIAALPSPVAEERIVSGEAI